MEELEDGADFLAATLCKFLRIKRVELLASQPDAARVGRHDSAQTVQECRLPRTGGSKEREALLRLYLEADVGEQGAFAEGFAEGLAFERRSFFHFIEKIIVNHI